MSGNKRTISINQLMNAIRQLPPDKTADEQGKPHDPQQQQCLDWLGRYRDRRRGQRRDAEDAYNNIAEPAILLWLIKAFGVASRLVQAARRASAKAATAQQKAAAIRRHVPWQAVATRLLANDNAVRAKTGQGNQDLQESQPAPQDAQPAHDDLLSTATAYALTLQLPTIQRLLSHAAAIIYGKADILNSMNLPSDQRAAMLDSILDDIEKCTSFSCPLVSHAAMRKSIGTSVHLRRMGKYDQPLFDRGRKVFHFEYLVPLTLIRSECLKQTTMEKVLDVLESMVGGVWVLKTELAAMMRLRRRNLQPDLRAVCRKAGIELLTEDEQLCWEGTAAFIYDALIALVRRGRDGSFVIFQEPQSRKFVQFGVGRHLGMDVPCVALSSEEADRASQFYRELGEPGPREYHAPDTATGKTNHGATFYHDFGQDATSASRAAAAFFATVYRLPADVSIVSEDH